MYGRGGIPMIFELADEVFPSRFPNPNTAEKHPCFTGMDGTPFTIALECVCAGGSPGTFSPVLYLSSR